MSKRQRGRGKGPGGAPPQARPGGGPGGQQPGGWGPVRDAVRRDLEQAVQALAFAERLHERLDGQRRLFADFPRVMEEMRSGALERISIALSRLYEGGPGVVDVARFLRDLPLALAHLAAAEAQARRASASADPATPAGGEASPGAAQDGVNAGTGGAAEMGQSPTRPTGLAEPTQPAQAASLGGATEEASSASEAPASPPASPLGASAPVSPRVELRARLLAAAPQLTRAAQSYRRNAVTVRRACAPRRSTGPWRSDKEVLDQARRAVDFAQKLYDAYAEAWADAPLAPDAFEATAAEADRFLAWTQLVRYVDVARAHGPVETPVPSSSPPAAAAAPEASGAGSPSA